MEKFLAEAGSDLPTPWRLPALDACAPRAPIHKHGHVGVHAQSGPGLYYIGVVLPVGRIQASQLQGFTNIAERYGSGPAATDGMAKPVGIRHP